MRSPPSCPFSRCATWSFSLHDRAHPGGPNQSIRAIEESLGHGRLIFLLTQKDPSVEEPEADDLPVVGCIAMVMRMHRAGDGGMKVLVQGLMKRAAPRSRVTSPACALALKRSRTSSRPSCPMSAKKVIESVRDKLDTPAGDLQGPGSDTIMVLKGVQDPGAGSQTSPPRISRSTPPRRKRSSR